MSSLGRPTGPKPSFSRQDVVDAALEEGVDAFSLTAVARRLGVRTSALYRTVSSRDDLLRACLDRLGDQAAVPVAAAIRSAQGRHDWEPVLRAGAESMWEVLEAHPGLSRVLLTVPWAFQSFATVMNAFLEALEAEGLEHADAVLALDATGDTLVSAHLSLRAMRTAGPLEDWPRTRPGVRLPNELVPDRSLVWRGFLDAKLKLIVAGLRHLHDHD